MRSLSRKAAWVLACFMAVSCSKLDRQTSPIQLIVTTAQTLQLIDIFTPTNAKCAAGLGTINITALVKNPLTNTTDFNQVQIDRYQVSYVRTDGGKTVPQGFVRSISILLTPGMGATLSNFSVLQSDALTQAPFAALLPQNGGRDPDTGRTIVKLDVIVDVFGQTLAGEKVSGETRIPVDFCYNCGGCS